MSIPTIAIFGSRTILKTKDGQRIVRPQIDIHTSVQSKDGNSVYHLSQEGVQQWNAGNEITGISMIIRTPLFIGDCVY